MKYIVIRNWDRFQHYKERRPLWIKVYTNLLYNDDYLRLTVVQRSLLHGLWLMYALSGRCVPLDIQLINSKLDLCVKMKTVQSLVDAGFIEISDSKPVADGYHFDALETETEKETETPLTPLSKNGARRTGYRWVRGTHGGSYVCDVNGTDELPRGVQPPVATKRVEKKDDPEPLTVPMPAENREQLKKLLGASR